MNSPSITPVLTVEAARVEAEPWPTPISLSCPPPPTLDLEKAIPPGLAPFREFCEATAEALQVSPDLVAPLVLALASIGTSRALEVELSPQWRETSPLWVCALAEPGERKSALLSMLGAPLHAWQDNERATLKHALGAYDERRKGIEARLNGSRAKQQKATGETVGTLEAEARDLRMSLENMPPLAPPELVTSDCTPEAMRDLLYRNGEKLGWVSAEVDAAQIMGNRYGKTAAPNVDLLLKAYTGDAASAHRIGRDMPLARPAISLALCVQPEALRAVLCDAYAAGRGLIPRLLLIAPPSRMGRRILHPSAVPPASLAWWHVTLRRLLDLSWPGRVILNTEGPIRCETPARVMRLSAEAETVFDALRLDLEARMGPDGDLRPVCAFASKLPGTVARIALILEAMQDPAAEFITADTMRAACEWAPFLLAHFRAVLGDAAESAEVKLARRLLAHVKRKNLAVLSANDALQALDGNGLTKDELKPALALLIDYDWLRELPAAQRSKGRPPSQRYAVNPAALA